MKTIGLIGGSSRESTFVYYQRLSRMARDRLGGLHSAKLLLWSFDSADIEKFQAVGDWNGATEAMPNAARTVERGRTQCIVVRTNTMQKMAASNRHNPGDSNQFNIS